MDIDLVNRVDWERRRKIRLAQVRDQSKAIAKTIRDRVHGAVEIQQEQNKSARNKTEQKFKSLALNKLKSDFDYLIQDVGSGYSVASIQPDPSIVMAEKQLINRCKAISRGTEAEKRQKRVQEEQQMDKEMKERRAHFNKTVEKIRSTLITSIPVDSGNSHKQNISKHNECFFIPSQVTLNESNIINWNQNKKTSKPWSIAINSKESQTPKYHKTKTNKDDNDKENELKISKFAKLETSVKNYETLVTELNKLSAEEQYIRNRLSANNWKEVPVPCKNSVHFMRQENDKNKEMTRHVLDKSANSVEIKTQTYEKELEESNSSSPIYISSSVSTSINYEHPIKVESIKKTVNIENKSEKNKLQSSSKKNYIKKPAAERPLRNINNMLQRIKKKKKLLAKEISADTKADIKILKTTSSADSKVSPIPKICAAGNDLRKESPLDYAKLPDSFYNSQLEILKEHISKKNTEHNRSKCNQLINEDLMRYINVLLKMTPSDVSNLSTSSCSSVKLEESIILEHPNQNTQYYDEMLNCISKCFNEDISDIIQDTVFESPKNINLLNRLEELSNYYLEKTHEMKNICDELPQITNDKLNEQNNVKEPEIIQDSVNISSNSSVDGEYIWGHLNTLMQKKGLIRSDKEWPMFENISDNDENKSLTDQLLDI